MPESLAQEATVRLDPNGVELASSGISLEFLWCLKLEEV